MANAKKKIARLLAYIFVPAIFACLGYLLLYLAFQPVWDIAVNGAMMLSAEEAPNFDPGLTNIYRPFSPSDDEPTEAPGTDTDYDPWHVPGPGDPGYSVDPGGSYSPTADPDTTPDPSRPTNTPAPATEEPPFYERPHPTGPISVKDIELPTSGARYGHLYMGRIGLNAPVYWDDTRAILRHGVGTYRGSFMPGFGRLILLSAHNTTFFRCLRNIEVGDVITFDTNYDTYKYRVYQIEVKNEAVLGREAENMMIQDNEVLMMYTCYPFHAIIGRKTDRLVVYAERIEGVDVIWRF